MLFRLFSILSSFGPIHLILVEVGANIVVQEWMKGIIVHYIGNERENLRHLKYSNLMTQGRVSSGCVNHRD